MCVYGRMCVYVSEGLGTYERLYRPNSDLQAWFYKRRVKFNPCLNLTPRKPLSEIPSSALFQIFIFRLSRKIISEHEWKCCIIIFSFKYNSISFLRDDRSYETPDG